MKLSQGKTSYPGEKQVFRRSEDGEYVGDTLGVRGEDRPGEPLLSPVVEDGQVVADRPSLDEIRERAATERRRLPRDVRALQAPATYPVETSDRLADLTERTRDEIAARHGPRD